MEEQLQKLRDQVVQMREIASIAPDLETSKEISLRLVSLLGSVIEMLGARLGGADSSAE